MTVAIEHFAPVGTPYSDSPIFIWPPKKKIWIPKGFLLDPASDDAEDGFGTPFYDMSNVSVEKKSDPWGTINGGIGQVLINNYINNRYTRRKEDDPETGGLYGLEEEPIIGSWFLHHPYEVPYKDVSLYIWILTNELRQDGSLEPFIFPLRDTYDHANAILKEIAFSGKQFHDHPNFREHFRTFEERVSKDGAAPLSAENLASGDRLELGRLSPYALAQEIFTAWKESPEHLEAMTGFTEDTDKKKVWLEVGSNKAAVISESESEGVFEPPRDSLAFSQVMKNSEDWIVHYDIDWKGEVFEESVNLSWYGSRRYEVMETVAPRLSICGRQFFAPDDQMVFGACIRELTEGEDVKAWIFLFCLPLDAEGAVVTDGNLKVFKTEYAFAERIEASDGEITFKHYIRDFSDQDLDWEEVTTLDVKPGGEDPFDNLLGSALFNSSGTEGIIANYGPYLQQKTITDDLKFMRAAELIAHTSEANLLAGVETFPATPGTGGNTNWENPSYVHPYFFKIKIGETGQVTVEPMSSPTVKGKSELKYDAEGTRLHPRNDDSIHWLPEDGKDKFAVTTWENHVDGTYTYAYDYIDDELVQASIEIKRDEKKEYWYAPELLSHGTIGYYTEVGKYHENRILILDNTVKVTLRYTFDGQEQEVVLTDIDEDIEIDEIRRLFIDRLRNFDNAPELDLPTESREYIPVVDAENQRPLKSVTRYLANFDLRTGHVSYLEVTRSREEYTNVYANDFQKLAVGETPPIGHYQVTNYAWNSELPPTPPTPIAGSECIIVAEPAHYTGWNNPYIPNGRHFVHYLDYEVKGNYKFIADGEEVWVIDGVKEQRERLHSPFGAEYAAEIRVVDNTTRAFRFYTDFGMPLRVWIDEGTYHHGWNYQIGYGEEAIAESESFFGLVYRFSDLPVGDYNVSTRHFQGEVKEPGLIEHVSFLGTIYHVPILYRTAARTAENGDLVFTNEIWDTRGYRYPVFLTAKYEDVTVASVDFEEFWESENPLEERYKVWSSDSEVQDLLNSIPGANKRLRYLREIL